MLKKLLKDVEITPKKIAMYALMGILFVIMVIFTITTSSNPIKRASKGANDKKLASGLSTSQDAECVFKIDENVLPYMNVFKTTEYVIGAPRDMLLEMENGTAYRIGNDGLVLAECVYDDDIHSITGSIFSNIYAVNKGDAYDVIDSAEGYLNGYRTKYERAIVTLANDKSKKNILSYILKVDECGIVIMMITEDGTTEHLSELVDYAKILSESIINPKFINGAEQKLPEETLSELPDEQDASLISSSATIVVDENYKVLRLLFGYLDISQTPYVYLTNMDTNEEYELETKIPGEYSFLVPNARKGDVLKISVKCPNKLEGTTIEMIENEEYIKEQNKLIEGALHVQPDE